MNFSFTFMPNWFTFFCDEKTNQNGNNKKHQFIYYSLEVQQQPLFSHKIFYYFKCVWKEIILLQNKT